jgi:hypothetical protein
MFARTLCISVAACVAFPIAGRAQTDASAAPITHMAPTAQYLMPRDSEIAFARTAAPSAVAHDAKILVLTAHGYETAVPGTNGFVCLVTRSWDLAATRPSATYWNPMFRVAQCYNAQGAQTIIPVYLMKTAWALAGASEAEIGAREQAAWADGTLKKGGAPGAMGYMMSNRSWGVGASPGPWRPHLMFYYPTAQAPNWGADLDGSPIASSSTSGSAGTTVYFVVVPAWSDGSPAPALAPARAASSAGQ